MSVLCPCCNRPMEAPYAPVSALKEAPLSLQRRAIVEVLADAYPLTVGIPAIVDAMYRNDPEGGAETASGVLRCQLVHIRKQLATFGWTIPRATHGGGNYGRYRLEPIQDQSNRRFRP